MGRSHGAGEAASIRPGAVLYEFPSGKTEQSRRIRQPELPRVRIITLGLRWVLTATVSLFKIPCSHSQRLLGLFACFTPRLISVFQIGFGVPPKLPPGMPFSPCWNGGLLNPADGVDVVSWPGPRAFHPSADG